MYSYRLTLAVRQIEISLSPVLPNIIGLRADTRRLANFAEEKTIS